jgi:hypothetical protein
MSDPTPHIPPEESMPELLSGYVLGDLTASEMASVDRYLAEHPERAAELASLKRSLDLLPLALPAAKPPASLRQRIVEIATAESTAASAVIGQLKTHNRSPKWVWRSIGGLGVSLLAGLWWYNCRICEELASAKQHLSAYQSVVSLLQQPNNRFLALKSTPGKSMGMGSLVMVPQKSAAVLTLQQMPPLPQGKVYRVWAIMDDKEMACADFLPDDRGKVMMQFPLANWGTAKKVMVTIEDKNAKEAEGEIAIEGEVGV